MRPTRHLVIGLLVFAVSGCTRERPLTVEQQAATRPLPLREHVGQEITLRGRFSLRGKEAPFVLVGQEPVYLVSQAPFSWGEPYISMDNREVTITGVLRRVESPRTTKPIPDSVQQMPPHFFFEIRDTKISLAR